MVLNLFFFLEGWGGEISRSSRESSARCLAIITTICAKAECLSLLCKSHPVTVLRAKTTGNTSSHGNLLLCPRAEHSTHQHPKKPCSGLGMDTKTGTPIAAYSYRARSLGTLEVTCKGRSLQKPGLSWDCNSCRTKTAPKGTTGMQRGALKPEPKTD